MGVIEPITHYISCSLHALGKEKEIASKPCLEGSLVDKFSIIPLAISRLECLAYPKYGDNEWKSLVFESNVVVDGWGLLP